MAIILSVVATIVLIGLCASIGNIWDVPAQTYYAARWAVILWVGLFDALLMLAAIWSLYGYPTVTINW